MTLIDKQVVDPAWGDFATSCVPLSSSQPFVNVMLGRLPASSRVVLAYPEKGRTTTKHILLSTPQLMLETWPEMRRRFMNSSPAAS
jgi:hypothetical protein